MFHKPDKEIQKIVLVIFIHQKFMYKVFIPRVNYTVFLYSKEETSSWLTKQK